MLLLATRASFQFVLVNTMKTIMNPLRPRRTTFDLSYITEICEKEKYWVSHKSQIYPGIKILILITLPHSPQRCTTMVA